MKKKNQNTSFETLTEWLNQNSDHHAVSRGQNKVLKKDNIQEHMKITEALTGTEKRHHPHSNEARPLINLIKDGDIISGIQVKCSCGEIIQIDLEYNKETDSLVYKNDLEK